MTSNLAKLLILTLLMTVPSQLFAADKEPSNFLILVGDDIDWKDYGCYGNDVIRTPHIDQLAQAGLICRNAFLTTSSCSPSRISVLTGTYPHATGAEDLHMPLPADQKLIPSYLQEKGYFTGHMQKTHYGPNGNKQFQWYSKKVNEFPKFLGAKGKKPFFMWVGFYDAHRPYRKGAVDPPHDPAKVKVPPFLADTPETRADLALYYDEISRMDSNIGSMVSELKRRKLFDNTVVVFFGDNGMPFPRAKGSVYDSGIGTPLIFCWPRAIKAGSEHHGLASVIDLAPTVLDLAGIRKPAGMQGQSMTPVLKDPAKPGREYIFAERNWHNCDEHIRCVRTRQYKLIRNAYLDVPLGNPADTSRCPSWHSLLALKKGGKLTAEQIQVFRTPRPKLELYDVGKDPWEFRNLALDKKHAKVVGQLETVLARWGKETGDFPPERRRRGDNTNRVTGVKFTREIPPLKE